MTECRAGVNHSVGASDSYKVGLMNMAGPQRSPQFGTTYGVKLILCANLPPEIRLCGVTQQHSYQTGHP